MKYYEKKQIKAFKRAAKRLPARSFVEATHSDGENDHAIPAICAEGNSIEIDGPDRDIFARDLLDLLNGAEAMAERLAAFEAVNDRKDN